MTVYSTDGARDALAGLVGAGAAVPLTDPVLVGQVMDGARQAYADVCKERDELRDALTDTRGRLADARRCITAARQITFPLMRDRNLLGDLARDIDAALDPDA